MPIKNLTNNQLRDALDECLALLEEYQQATNGLWLDMWQEEISW